MSSLTPGAPARAAQNIAPPRAPHLAGLAGLILKAAAVWLGVLFLTLNTQQAALAQGYAYPGAYPGAAPKPSGLGGFLSGLFTKPEPASPPLSAPMPQLYQPTQSARPGMPQTGVQPALPGGEPRAKSAQSSLGGGLRTMCVRLCDGAYWPITYNASRGRLARDGKVCAASCESEARLFTMPNSGEAKDMVDLNGRSYTKLPSAFRFRKGAVADCRCRPEAWSDAALARHQGYVQKVATRTEAPAPPQASATAEPAPADTPRRMSLADLDTLALSGAVIDPTAAPPAPVAGLPPAPNLAGAAMAEITPASSSPDSAPARKSAKTTRTALDKSAGPKPKAQLVSAAPRDRYPVTYRQIATGTPAAPPRPLPRQPHVLVQPANSPYRTN